MAEYVIEMLNITKVFPGIKANDNITLQLRPGEIHALLGENGASKLWDQGIYQSKYSQRVIGYQETYIKELNGNDQM